MISVYLFCFVVGGFFVGASVFGAHHDAGGDGIFHGLEGASPDQVAHALHVDMHTELAQLPAGHVEGEHAVDLLQTDMVPAVRERKFHPARALLSFRFWTFGSCFFGMTGLALSLLTGVGPFATLLVSAAMGAGCGGAASWVIGTLRATEVSGHVTHDDYIGAVGTVLVPIAPGRTGKVRCMLRGHTEDLLARAQESSDLAEGTEVLVLGFEDGEAVVVHAARLLSGMSRRAKREVS